MASGSSKGFDFASDDILCSYDNQQQSNPTHSDPPIPTNSNKQELNKSRMARRDNNEEVIIMGVEKSVKKQTDNVMRFLEGLSSRLSQLELYCYNLDKSIGEMRSDLTQDHVESEAKLKFLEKHLQEVHRSVQILRDKQELADTQKELAKLQLARKESNDSKNDTPSNRKNETPVASHGQHLALVPAPAPQPPPMSQPQPQPQPQTHAYYLPPGPTPTQVQSVPQYQQQWTPQVQPQPGSVASRPSSPQVYPQYLPTKPSVNPSPEPHSNSMPMQMTYSTIAPPGSNQPVAYSYGPPVRATQPQQQKAGFGHQSGTGDGYMVYDNGHLIQGGNMYLPGQQHSGGGVIQQFMRNHPYGEVIDKLVSMGYRRDHVMGVIQRMDESGQTVDFNGVLDRLNGGRVWSG